MRNESENVMTSEPLSASAEARALAGTGGQRPPWLMKPGYRLGLVLSAAFVLLAYKSLTIAPLAPLPILLGWALETTVLGALWAASEIAQRSPYRALRGGAIAAFFVLFYLIVVPSLAHTFFYESAAERRFTLLELDLSSAGFFFGHVLPRRGLMLLCGLLAVMHVLPFPLMPALGALPARNVALALSAAWAVLAPALAARPRVPAPLADTGAELWEQLMTPEVVVDRTRPARYDPRYLDKSGAFPALDAPFDKVLVFVMETMTKEAVAREQRVLPPTTFVHRARAHAHVYTRYLATNQDSRTGLLSMLGSRFIPYEAYTEEGRDHYMFLGKKSSLVDRFTKLGFRTAFAASQEEVELVVGDLPWDEVIHLDEGEAARRKGSALCFVPYEFEHSCEDRVLLPRVFAFLDQNPRAFLYQEFIWGHASEYNEVSGRSNTEYYSSYLDAIVEHLAQTGALAQTLIVVTSDHGFRDKGQQSERSVYELPLWFYAERFAPDEDVRLFSHLDFKDLLAHELWPAQTAARESPYVLTVGPTGTGFIAALTQSGQFMLLKARAGSRYLVHAEAPARAPSANTDDEEPVVQAGNFLRLYEDYLASFSSL